MNASVPFKSIIASAAAAGALCVGASLAAASEYVQTNLVSDIPGLASVTDPNLKNPWGVSFLPGSPFWVSNQGSSTSTLYAVTATTVAKVPLTVAIPTTGVGPQGPTGQVANANSKSFILGDGAAASFIFANLNGEISAWNFGLTPNTSAVTVVPASGAVYTGLAIDSTDTTLYAANDSAGTIDVFDKSFKPKSLGAKAFATPTSISGLRLVPFNVEDLAGNVYVTYAPDSHPLQTSATAGQGAVAEFSENGAFEKIVVPGGVGEPLASPWGVAWAPATFGKFGGDLLVGNFSFVDSQIDAIDPATGALVGTIPIHLGASETAGGLWTLTFGGGGNDGNPNVLYFADGINGEADGLFGAIVNIPKPSTWLMMLAGFGGLALFARRRFPLAIG